MRVLSINNGYPSEANPNYTTYVKTIDDCIKECGCQVSNLVLRYNGKITASRKLIQYLKFWSKCLFSKLDADIVYINHLPFAWTILFNPNLKKRRVIVHWHGNDLVGDSKLLRIIHKMIKKRAERFEHIVPSEYFRKELLRKFPAYNPLYVSPSGGVDTDEFSPHPCEKCQEQIVIGFASGLTTGKGADVLCEIMKCSDKLEKVSNSQIIFKIVNYGGEADHYISLFKETGAKLEFVEKMDKNKMPDYYNSISILLMPSKRKGESLGLVVLEAMSCGKPVVTHDICAFPEFVVSGISGERSLYSPDLMIRTNSTIECIKRILSNLSSYTPRKVVLDRYSKQSVVDFYRKLLKNHVQT